MEERNMRNQGERKDEKGGTYCKKEHRLFFYTSIINSLHVHIHKGREEGQEESV
jgi:hypothetical protein